MERIRIDKWLWAARVFRHRSISTRACTSGRVQLNGLSVKPSKMVRVGDRIEANTEGGLRILVVLAIADKRGPASVAKELYEDHSPEPEKSLVARILRDPGLGRPTKRERRRVDHVQGKGFEDY